MNVVPLALMTQMVHQHAARLLYGCIFALCVKAKKN